MSANLQSILASLALTSGEQEIVDEISVGHQRGSLPFGGKLRQPAGGGRSFSPMSVGAIGDGTGVPNGGSPEAVLMQILASLGGRPCQVRGEPMPAGDCARRLCLTQLFFGVSVAGSATGQTYELLARDWFLPLVWVDLQTAATVSIVSVTYKQDPLFESGNTIAIQPDLAFPADSNWNFVIGLPAISDKTGYVFSLANSDAAAASFNGKFVGVGVRSA